MSETKNIDTKVLELFNSVREKQKKLIANERVNWMTSCVIGKNPDSTQDRINLHTVTELSKLVDMHVFLKQKLDYWKNSCDFLGVKVPLEWMGYPVGDWEKDIKARVNQLQLNKERAELKALEARLDSLITIDQRREMELAAIEKEMGI